MDTLLLTFLVKEKSVPVWAARAHETENLIKPSIIYKTTKILKEVFLCPHNKL